MGEHKQPVKSGQKAKWDSLRGVDLRHKRYIWRTEKGTFKYPKDTYGAIRSRRQYKVVRKFIKHSLGMRGKERTKVMLNIMGVIDE